MKDIIPTSRTIRRARWNVRHLKNRTDRSRIFASAARLLAIYKMTKGKNNA